MKIDIIKDCKEIVAEMVGDEMAQKWWETPTPTFSGKTPNEVLDASPTEVYSFLINMIQCNY